MSQTIRQRRELRAVHGKPPTTLLSGMPWTKRNNASSHATVANFLQRQIARGLKIKEQQ